jgi:gamma-glutamyltranspeptidase
MMESVKSRDGMVVAPHHLAATAGADVLREGGNAIEAMVAAAAAITVCYPHMNGLGGDNFWLIHQPGNTPVGIDACGAAAKLASADFYHDQNLAAIPGRGPLSALTMAGAVSGWQTALEHSTNKWGGKLPLERLLTPAIEYARQGLPVTNTLASNLSAKISELQDQPGFNELYSNEGQLLTAGTSLKLPVIANTLEALVHNGLDDFYRGELARSMAADLETLGSPLRLPDFIRHRALSVKPLGLEVAGHQLYNLPPPTQGLASLLLLGVFDRLGIQSIDTFDYVHGLVEATKAAFRIRDAHICDPAYMTQDVQKFLDSSYLDDLASRIDMRQAAPWPDQSSHGDTVWLGAIDREGRCVSFIQSIYWEFGSGVILPESGITWQNRGTSFSLDAQNINHLQPGKRPFHTIQPALALLADGRNMVYGTMGGEGQPQTQAMIFARHVMNGQELQQTITAPRWLLGRTWGSEQTNLRIENRFDSTLYEELRAAGHDLEVIGEYDEVMGHAGALVHHDDGQIEGASDPRSDGAAIGA